MNAATATPALNLNAAVCPSGNYPLDPDGGYEPLGSISNPLPAIPAPGTLVQMFRHHGKNSTGVATVCVEQPRIEQATGRGRDPLKAQFPGNKARRVDVLVLRNREDAPHAWAAAARGKGYHYITFFVATTPEA